MGEVAVFFANRRAANRLETLARFISNSTTSVTPPHPLLREFHTLVSASAFAGRYHGEALALIDAEADGIKYCATFDQLMKVCWNINTRARAA